MPFLNRDNSRLADRILTIMENPPPRPPPRVRTCHGCFKTFHYRDHRPHVRNDCGQMISVDQLRAAMQEHANMSGEDSISFIDLGIMVEHIAITRLSSINAGLEQGEDIEVRVERGRRTSLLDHERKTRERVEARARRRAERGVDSVTEQVSQMEL
ncbi:hypothetical protein RhiJN_09805 [Ceratobasidium sp. AG-Ba]|nr:hypothetical protein RhiJN_09805 [Ceratobasidium sp. AG-Ba]QRW10557.1 hypothetical protein RhiLY_09556 [Ceratobasidium sp. AG-Ba]